MFFKLFFFLLILTMILATFTIDDDTQSILSSILCVMISMNRLPNVMWLVCVP